MSIGIDIDIKFNCFSVILFGVVHVSLGVGRCVCKKVMVAGMVLWLRRRHRNSRMAWQGFRSHRVDKLRLRGVAVG